jgi:exopolyphosphatase/guanosine-5'-triphosphate,3'-diphosphate pyrophosphatase
MRLGVLDVGSNTVHLLVVDAHRGAHPWPAHSEKSVLRLADELGADGSISPASADALVGAVAAAQQAAERLRVAELLAFATSAVRDAANGPQVLARVREATGVDLQVLSGEEEARVTFLAVRRWFGWSAGRLLVVDIGGGSLEVAAGLDEEPELAFSVPLGAGRLTRDHLAEGTPAGGESTGHPLARDAPPPAEAVDALGSYVAATLEPVAAKLVAAPWDRAVGTSKTLRSLARLAGAAPSGAGPRVPRQLTATGLQQLLGFIRHIPAGALAGMAGVSASRAHQLLAGAVVAATVMERLEIDVLHLCPWALREGVILRRLDLT